MLPGIEIVIATVQSIKFFVGAAFDNLSLFDDQDLIGSADGGKAMRYDEGGSSLHQVGKTLLDKLLRLGVKTRSSFVKNEDARLRKNGSGNRNPLALSSREFHSSFADHGVVLVRKALGELVHARDAAGSQDIFFAGIET